MSLRKVICRVCGMRLTDNLLLSAPSPFDPFDTLLACPGCREVNSVRTVCDEDGCWLEDMYGTPIPNGYRRTCHMHVPGSATASPLISVRTHGNEQT